VVALLAGSLASVALVLGGCSSPEQPPTGAQDAAAQDGSAPSSATSPATGAQWQLLPPGLETPRDDFGAAEVDGRIWVMGGMTGDRGTRLDTIEVLDTRDGDGQWRTIPQRVPVGLASFETAAVGERIYLFGGLDEQTEPSDFAAYFDTSTRTWTEVAPLPRARYAHTVTVHDGRIYVIGGESVAGPVAAVDVYDPTTGRWSAGAPMPRARGSHDTVSAAGRLYVLGGWLDAGPTDLVQTYDPASGRWREAEPLPEPVSRAGATVLDGRVWVSYHRFSASLDVQTGQWAPADPLQISRHGLGYLAVEGSIYAVGGCTEWPLRDVRTVGVLEPA
jgi:hypothetical protein